MSQIQEWARALGFSQIGVSGVDLSGAESGLSAWLEKGFHGDMHYMSAHGLKRARPSELVPGTVSVITARMDYLPMHTPDDWQTVEWSALAQPLQGQISVYARGRDYHKVMRARLQQLATRISEAFGPMGFRVFTDSAPVLEVELGARSGLGWRGKHTLLIDRDAGSVFFLGEIYVDMNLPSTPVTSAHCGSCRACLDICPTQAIVAPYQLDARLCLSYLTIEHSGPIPLDLRGAMGNRIYGCDDCQLVCPWNKFAKRSVLPDFDAREALNAPGLCELFSWSEQEFLRHTEGSAIRRIGHERWLRNVAVALGNALRSIDADLSQGVSNAGLLLGQREQVQTALSKRIDDPSLLVREHVRWAMASPIPSCEGAPPPTVSQ